MMSWGKAQSEIQQEVRREIKRRAVTKKFRAVAPAVRVQDIPGIELGLIIGLVKWHKICLQSYGQGCQVVKQAMLGEGLALKELERLDNYGKEFE